MIHIIPGDETYEIWDVKNEKTQDWRLETKLGPGPFLTPNPLPWPAPSVLCFPTRARRIPIDWFPANSPGVFTLSLT